MIDHMNVFVEVLPQAGIKLGTAVLCGLLLGMEREHKNKPAGLRTILLITVGATIFMIVSDVITIMTRGPSDITRVDPSRIAAQVVSGIGFLGAGAIIQARGSVHGLTTAATIWVAAGIGLCVGVGLPLLGVLVTLLVLLLLVLLDPIGDWLSRTGEKRTIEVLVADDSLAVHRVKDLLRQYNVRPDQTWFTRVDEKTLQARFVASGASEPRLIVALSHVEGVRGASLGDVDD